MSLTSELCDLLSHIERQSFRKADITITMPRDQLMAASFAIEHSLGMTIYGGAGGRVNGFEFQGIKFEPKTLSQNDWPDYDQSG